MGRRKRKQVIIENLKISGIAEKGFAVGKTEEGEVIFVENAVPGDTINAIILKKKKNYSLGKAISFIHYSEYRVKPFCRHFEHCGGCKWQNLQYDSQLYYKNLKVENALKRIGKVNIEGLINPIRGSKDIKYYRNKLEFSFCDKRWLTPEEIETKGHIEQEPALGFHRPGSFSKVLNIEECLLQNDISNEIRNHIKLFCINKQISFYNPHTHNGVMRSLIIRNSFYGEWMVIVVFGKDDHKKIKLVMDEIKEKFPFINSLNYVVNLKMNDTIYDQIVSCYYGNPYIVEKLGGIKYKIGPKSFFQTNSQGAKLLFDYVVEFADLKGHENVYDLYTGIGSIALYIADKVKYVTGIEEIPEAIEDAKRNMEFNKINNASFYAGDVQDIMNDEFISKHGNPDVVITDPPRAGMSDKVVRTLLSIEAPTIVYVSCNPDTQARDILLLSEKYKLERIQPVDMFPHTNHVENIVKLVLK